MTRLDDVAAVEGALVALRVAGVPIEGGMVAGSIAEQPRRLVPWSVSR